MMSTLKYSDDYGEGVCKILTYWIGLIQDTNNDGVSLNHDGAERLKDDLRIIRDYIKSLNEEDAPIAAKKMMNEEKMNEDK